MESRERMQKQDGMRSPSANSGRSQLRIDTCRQSCFAQFPNVDRSVFFAFSMTPRFSHTRQKAHVSNPCRNN